MFSTRYASGTEVHFSATSLEVKKGNRKVKGIFHSNDDSDIRFIRSFKGKIEAPSILVRFQKICVHTYRFRIVFARPPCNADQERSYMVASVRHTGAHSCLFDDVAVFR